MSDESPIRFVTFGARHELGQLPRIDAGLLSIGAVQAEVGSPNVDLIYANDEPRWQEAIDYRDKVAPHAKLILCVLDLPEISYPTFKPFDLLPRLRRADAVVAISLYVQSQLARLLSRASTFIGQPIKDITPDKRLAGQCPFPQYRVLMSGRLRDPGKRAEMAIQGLLMAGFEEKEVAVVGGEWPSWGTDLGIVSDSVLNDLYNSVDFVMQTSVFEGLGLPGLEAMAAGAVPIICHDLPTAHEFYPPHWMCFPHPHSVAYRLRALATNPDWLAAEKAISLGRGADVRKLLSGAAVAGRILDVYRSLIKPSTP